MPRHTIEASEKPVSDIFCDKFVFRIPSYQRPYAWTTEQTAELLSDLLNAWGAAQDVREASPYFLGSVVLIKDPEKPEADVVDGQQRLTTLTILLSVLRDLATDDAVARSIDRFICQKGDPILGTESVFRLTPRHRDEDFLRRAVQEEKATVTVHAPAGLRDAQARIAENTTFLRNELGKMPEPDRQKLSSYVAQRCYLVIVAASDQQSAFRIFSVLNSRGLDLTAADILKADIIGAIPPTKQEAYTRKWEDIEDGLGRERFSELFAHIRMIHRKQKLQGTLISEFRQFVPYQERPASFVDDSLRPYAEAFEEVTDQAFESPQHAGAINGQLRSLSRLDNTDWQPPAIEVLAKYRGEPETVLRVISDLERLAYGMFLMRSTPTDRIRRYGGVLGALQSEVDPFDAKSPLQLKDEERQQVLAALNGDIYTVTRIRLPLLLRLDEILAAGGAQYDSNIMSVEHVLPQTPAVGSQWLRDFPDEAERDAWVHKLANLVLLTRRKNAQASNADFDEKKERYFSARAGVANFALTNQVLATQAWTRETLQQRQHDLVGRLAEYWRLN